MTDHSDPPRLAALGLAVDRDGWALGPIALHQASSLEGDGLVQVGAAQPPEGGPPVVLIRLGLVVAAMSPEAAGNLGRSLVTEAALAQALGARTHHD